MLSLELEDICVITDELIENDCDRFTVVDLDFCTAEELKSYAESSTLIGFAKSESEIPENKSKLCLVVLKRPFYISDFLSLFGDYEKNKLYKEKKSNRSVTQKPHFLTVDKNSSSALWGEQKISLSEYEYKVLSLLCENRGEVVEREKIYSLLGAEDGNMGDVYICHLRRKIDNKLGLKLIYTIRGKGYMLKN
jgi:hypothetical protein